MPSLGMATKLARGLREIHDEADTSAALSVVSMGPQNPTARVEYALRADEALTEAQVRQIMEYYLAVRMRRYGRTFAEGASNGPHSDRSRERSMGATAGPGTVGRTAAGGVVGTVRSVGTATAVSTVRTVSRQSGREPGRY